MESTIIKSTMTEDEFGNKSWKLPNGDYHRLDGPAIIYADGTEAWFKDDLKHRENGPAITYTNGNLTWFINGLLHREDGPAMVWGRLNKYFINDVYYSALEYRELTSKEKTREQ
jgi:hypothetical protein